MLRGRLIGDAKVEKTGFRWRSTEVSRLEALSDAVFGFAITLLVVSLEVPASFGEMISLFRGLPAFAASFALLFMVWMNQYRFFRRYGMEDAVVVTLNAVLLFVILFFVYPLKFVFQLVVAIMFGPAWLPRAAGAHGPILTAEQGPLMMVVFGAGYAAVFGIFALLHLHALRRADALELNEVERFETVDNVRESLLNVGIAALSVTIAAVGGPGWTQLAGFSYWLVGVVMTVNGFYAGAGRKRLRAKLAAVPPETAGAEPAALA